MTTSLEFIASSAEKINVFFSSLSDCGVAAQYGLQLLVPDFDLERKERVMKIYRNFLQDIKLLLAMLERIQLEQPESVDPQPLSSTWDGHSQWQKLPTKVPVCPEASRVSRTDTPADVSPGPDSVTLVFEPSSLAPAPGEAPGLAAAPGAATGAETVLPTGPATENGAVTAGSSPSPAPVNGAESTETVLTTEEAIPRIVWKEGDLHCNSDSRLGVDAESGQTPGSVESRAVEAGRPARPSDPAAVVSRPAGSRVPVVTLRSGTLVSLPARGAATKSPVVTARAQTGTTVVTARGDPVSTDGAVRSDAAATDDDGDDAVLAPAQLDVAGTCSPRLMEPSTDPLDTSSSDWHVSRVLSVKPAVMADAGARLASAEGAGQTAELRSASYADSRLTVPQSQTNNAVEASGGTDNTAREDETPRPPSYPCCFCAESFDIPQTLEVHLKNEHGKNYQCTVCSETLSSLRDFTEHMRVEHLTTRPLRCRLCGAHSRTLQAFRRHLDTHQSARGAICEVCGKSFTRPDYLRIHQRLHEQYGRRHGCRLCHKTFSNVSNLNTHFRLHTGERRFVCDRCSLSFHRPDKLKLHLAKAHDERPPVQRARRAVRVTSDSPG